MLRACRKRPRSRRAAKQHDELAPFHSITSSARASNVGGISRRIARAVGLATRHLLQCMSSRHGAGQAQASRSPHSEGTAQTITSCGPITSNPHPRAVMMRGHASQADRASLERGGSSEPPTAAYSFNSVSSDFRPSYREPTATPAVLKSLTQAREQPAGKACSSVTDILV